ncbi:MAG TPA: MauE/DoxX family redox-associated membrane protein [Blastocatellia bacterium]|nr:MauE/DoxX family redox-associated membrane protein [Blastocatellia bacterium]
MTLLLTITRLLLTAILSVAGTAKLLDREGSRRALQEFGVPESASPTFAWILPFVEIALAIAVLPAAGVEWASLGTLLLFLVFSVAIAINVVRGKTADCHCFGQLHSAPVSWKTLARNLVFTGLAGFLTLQHQEAAQTSLIAWIVNLSISERANLAVGVIALVLLSVLTYISVRLLKQQKELADQIAELQDRLADDGLSQPAVRKDIVFPTKGLPIGSPAPLFELSSLTEDKIALGDLLENGKPALLAFVSPNCGPCESLLPDIERWQTDYADRMNVALISSGDVKENKAKFSKRKIATVLLQNGSAIDKSYEAHWTPTAVLVSSTGAIASQLAMGADGIKSLVDHVAKSKRIVPWTGNGSSHEENSLPKFGDIAPDFSLSDLDGNVVTLSDYRGKRLAVFFWNPACPFCVAMVDELKSFESLNNPTELLFISTGIVEANRALGLQSRILLDQDSSVMKLYGASGTPSAILVDEAGRIASLVEAGGPNTLALIGARRIEA